MSKILIIDAGGTSCASAVVDTSNGSHTISRSAGINAVTTKSLSQDIQQLLSPFLGQGIDHIKYLGAGCANEIIIDRVRAEISKQMPDAEVYASDDLTGAAFALCQSEKGLISILGTGSNIGYYDGQRVTDRINSGGYWLGDEGSGYRIGQEIYKRFVRNQLSADTAQRIEAAAQLKQDNAIPELYAHPAPQKTLSQFAKMISQLTDDEKESVLTEVFDGYRRLMVEPFYDKYQQPLSIIGSVAYAYQDFLSSYLREKGIQINQIAKSPLQGLIDYHLTQS